MQTLVSWFFISTYLGTQTLSILLLRRRRIFAETFDQRISPLAVYPPVTVITSLKGPTPQMTESLRSLLAQNYPGKIEFAIATKDEKEPLLQEAQALFRSEFPEGKVTWVNPVEVEGLNPRTAKIARAYEQAKTEWVFMTCVDTRFDPHFLRRAFDLNQGNLNSYVTGYPVIDGPENFAAKLEAIGLNLDVMQFFILSALSRALPIGYGGALLFNKSLLERSGGWDPILRLLTDDVTLARAFIKAGARAYLAPFPGFVREEKHSLKSFWQRQVRWKMIAKYFLPDLFFLAPLSWVPQAFLVLSWIFGDRSLFAMGAVCVLVRILASLLNQIYQATPERDWAHIWVIPIYDFASVVNWFQALFSTKIRWGSTEMTLDNRGAVSRTEAV